MARAKVTIGDIIVIVLLILIGASIITIGVTGILEGRALLWHKRKLGSLTDKSDP